MCCQRVVRHTITGQTQTNSRIVQRNTRPGNSLYDADVNKSYGTVWFTENVHGRRYQRHQTPLTTMTGAQRRRRPKQLWNRARKRYHRRQRDENVSCIQTK